MHIQNLNDIRGKTIRALAEKRRMGMWNPYRSNLASVDKDDLDSEVLYVLVDYRDDNRRIVKKTMNRRSAYAYNKRLEGTGMAWALLGGVKNRSF